MNRLLMETENRFSSKITVVDRDRITSRLIYDKNIFCATLF